MVESAEARLKADWRRLSKTPISVPFARGRAVTGIKISKSMSTAKFVVPMSMSTMVTISMGRLLYSPIPARRVENSPVKGNT